ncbi:hypothetical protein PRUPE_3G089300 [Prunus persica]|uniref:Uncharacterized protein n=1 Tax=Prunus persica TaxID=3760 RepID=A0A251PXS4_PRUPE|nr:hypothetical protein PRUPE_3G089300 [Prunus persica]
MLPYTHIQAYIILFFSSSKQSKKENRETNRSQTSHHLNPSLRSLGLQLRRFPFLLHYRILFLTRTLQLLKYQLVQLSLTCRVRSALNQLKLGGLDQRLSLFFGH